MHAEKLEFIQALTQLNLCRDDLDQALKSWCTLYYEDLFLKMRVDLCPTFAKLPEVLAEHIKDLAHAEDTLRKIGQNWASTHATKIVMADSPNNRYIRKLFGDKITLIALLPQN